MELLQKNSEWFLYNSRTLKILKIQIVDNEMIKMDNVLLKYFNDVKNDVIMLFSNIPNVHAVLKKINSRELKYTEYLNGDTEYSAKMIC